ncbi:MAG: hypothetical protein ACOYK9_06940 [Chlamydiia bacterium]
MSIHTSHLPLQESTLALHEHEPSAPLNLSNITSLESLQAMLKAITLPYYKKSTHSYFCKIEIPYSQCKLAHDTAKEQFTKAIQSCPLTSMVQFSTVKATPIPFLTPPAEKTTLDPSIFFWRLTPGVQVLIQKTKAAMSNTHRIFVAASQYNGTESTGPEVPKPGLAMKCSAHDYTQGPFAQRENPALFELINAFLAGFGFNQLANVLSEKGFEAYQNGYLTPKDHSTLDGLIEDFTRSGTELELPCMKMEKMDLLLASAPAFGEYTIDLTLPSEKLLDLQSKAALYGYKAQFNHVRDALTDPRNLNKTIVCHMTGVGLGVFSNNQTSAGNSFKQAALDFQNWLDVNKIGPERVKIIFESYVSSNNHADTDMHEFYRAAGLNYNPVDFGKEFPLGQEAPLMKTPPVIC